MGTATRRTYRVALVAAAVLVIAFGASGSRTPSLTTKQKTIERKLRQTKKKIAQKKGEKRTVLGQLNSTELELESAQSLLANNKFKLLSAQADLDAIVERLDRAKRRLARRQDLLAGRIVDIYEGEDLSYVNVVLGSDDMWTFLTRSHYLQRILESDTRLIEQIKEDKAAIEADKARQAERVAEIQSIQLRLEAERNRISSLADNKRKQLDAIENSIELYEKACDEYLAQSRAIGAEITRAQGTAKGRVRYAKPFKGGLIRPCSGRISSPFGYRVHPITKVYKLHRGVDIAARVGTSMKAAADGVVTISGWRGAYGYTVVIDHGGGVSTLYGHCSRLLARVGDEVRQGDTVARVGSTGLSTGPHAHFEKRMNGRPVNPM